jgi:hypothetical protein
MYAFQVRTSTSASTTFYKQKIRDQVSTARPLRDGGVALQLAFVVGPARVWPNLWKATIDALGPILGHDPGAGEWNARDGRITELGLHCSVDPTATNQVVIAIRARPAGRPVEPPRPTSRNSGPAAANDIPAEPRTWLVADDAGSELTSVLVAGAKSVCGI